MLIVAALGGNALLRRGERMTAEAQRGNVRRACLALRELIQDRHRIVVTHGNGPQVGLLALQAAAGPRDGAYPLDMLGAESEGLIGYMIEQELLNLLPPNSRVATLLTQVVVDSADPAFSHPTKPIGPLYSEAEAHDLERQRGWQMANDGQHRRRVVPSPRPLEILETSVIELLVNEQVHVICAGGGGIPVTTFAGAYHGVEAVVDKDAASALLARQLRADMLLLLTDVDAVYSNFGSADSAPIQKLSAADADPSRFPAGSMRPKLEAAVDFARLTGNPAAIGRMEDAAFLARGERGTRIQGNKQRPAASDKTPGNDCT